MPTEKELLTGFLSKTLNMDEAGVTSLYTEDGSELKPDAEATLLKLHADKISKLKPDTTKIATDQYNKAFKEIAGKKEAAFAKVLGLETDLIGDEFIEAAEKHVSEITSKGKEITVDAVRAHPEFKKREKELLLQVKEKDEKLIAEVDRITKENVRKEVLSKVHAKAIKAIKEKALLPADEENQLKQLKRLLLDPMGVYDYELDDNGEITGITKDGKRLEDAHGNARMFDEIVLSIAAENGMEFKVADPKNSPSGTGQNAAPAGGVKPIVLPKTEQEYAAYVSDSKIDVKDRTAMQEAWKAKAAQTV